MLVLGDAHASEPENKRVLLSIYGKSEEEVAIQVGDLLHYDLPVPTWFIAGNNEDFDLIERLRQGKIPEGTKNAHLLASTSVELEGIKVAGLSGNYAPTKYDLDRSELSGDRRRHFTHEDVERAKELSDIDVFLTHEAPHGLLAKKGYDVGCKYVDGILKEVSPDLCLVGHHHKHVEDTFGDTWIVSLAPVWESYYTLDPQTLTLSRYETHG